MNVYKMYYLEKAVQFYKKNINNNFEDLTSICSVAKIQKPNAEVIDYIKGSLAISYSEAIEIIHYFHNNQMPEYIRLRFIEELSKQYSVPSDIVIKRINSVSKLSSSLLFSKKIGEIYSNHENNHVQKMA